MNKALPWIAAILLAAAISAVAGHESAPLQAAPAQLEEPAHIPTGVCPRGHVGMWIDHATVECHKELP